MIYSRTRMLNMSMMALFTFSDPRRLTLMHGLGFCSKMKGEEKVGHGLTQVRLNFQ